MAWDGDGDDLFRDEDEDQDNDYRWDGVDFGKEFVVYLIDASSDMFLPLGKEEDESEKTYFGAVVKCVTEDMKARVISRDKDEVAVCFFNTREKLNFQESYGVYVFQANETGKSDQQQDEPCQPTAKLIKEFGNIHEVFEKKIGSGPGLTPGSRENPLYNALWVSQGLLRKGSTKNSSKRILLFTNNDDPFGDADVTAKADLQRTTIQRAKDAQDLGISVELFPFNRPGEEFNVSIFYAEIINLESDEHSNFMVVAAERFEDLVNQLRKKIYKKRVVRRLALSISHGINIAMQSYALIRMSNTGRYTWLDSTTNKLLKTERSFICSDTGALLTEPLQRFQEYRGRKVLFSSSELTEVKRVASAQLQLLGFKPLDCLKDYYNLRPATFLYPDEERIKGSNCAFVALYRAMLRLQKYAIAFLGGALSPQLVALVAQVEVKNEIGQIEPPGMYMIYLPYTDDIRNVEKLHTTGDTPAPRATEEQINKAVAMIKKIDLKDFSFENIPNPALQRHYAILQALALQEEDLPELQDSTMPDEAGMKKPSVATAVKAFKDAVYGEDHDLQEAEAALEKAKGSLTSQKRKAGEDAARRDYENYDWNELADTGKLKELTQTELRTYLVTHKLPIAGKKEAVIDRILTHMGK
eukprot:c24370_g1_i1 orf=258-2180(-)